MTCVPSDSGTVSVPELWFVGMMSFPKIGSGSKSHAAGGTSRMLPSGAPLSVSSMRPRGESGHAPPKTVTLNVTSPHAADGFGDAPNDVVVGRLSAKAGVAAIAAPAIMSAPKIAARVVKLIDFISVPSLAVPAWRQD
jgi:hypothetical protein